VIVALGMGVPTSAHFIYIPVVVILGIVLGFIMGSKAARDAFAMEQRKAEERAARQAERARARAASADGNKPPAT
jgi:arginine exporter protein ArgO